jgi:hypothetical protein
VTGIQDWKIGDRRSGIADIEVSGLFNRDIQTIGGVLQTRIVSGLNCQEPINAETWFKHICCGDLTECPDGCGGNTCSQEPGGRSACCTYAIDRSATFCSTVDDTACIIPSFASSGRRLEGKAKRAKDAAMLEATADNK